MSRSQPGTKQEGSTGRVSSSEGAAVRESMGWGPHLLECWELRGDQCGWRRSARWQQIKPGSQARRGKGSFRHRGSHPWVLGRRVVDLIYVFKRRLWLRCGGD